MKNKVSVYLLKTTLERDETKTETVELSLKDGASATILRTEKIHEEQTNPVFLILAAFFIFGIGTYCLIQTLKTSDNTYEIPSRREPQQPMESTSLYYYRYR